jgi:hypothetical protein
MIPRCSPPLMTRHVTFQQELAIRIVSRRATITCSAGSGIAAGDIAEGRPEPAASHNVHTAGRSEQDNWLTGQWHSPN